MNWFFGTIFLSLLSIQSLGQILIAPSVQIKISSKVPFANINAINKTAISLINLDDDSVFVKVTNADFHFNNRTMQIGFDNVYLPSNTYPQSIFRGKLNRPIDPDRKANYAVSASGKLCIRGVTRYTTLYGHLLVEKNTAVFNATFTIQIADFNIPPPHVIFLSTAHSIKVIMDCVYLLKRRPLY